MQTSSPERISQNIETGLWGEETLHSLLTQCCTRHPERLAVADQPNRQELTGTPALRLTYQELDNASTHLACTLLNEGIGQDDCVVVQLPNIAELLIVYYAVSKIGAVISPVPVQYGRHELTHISEVTDPVALITIGCFKDINLAHKAAATVPDSINLFAFGNQLPEGVLALQFETLENPQRCRQLKAYQKQHPATANHIISICWTSGTTGTPKGVPRSHNMWLSSARNCIEAGDYRAGDRLLNPFPLVNMAAVGGFLYPSVLVGCSIYLHHPIDPAVFLGQMQDEKITFTIVPPAILNQLAKHQDRWRQFDFSSLRSIGSGSAPLAPWMVDIFDNQYGKPIVNFYGSNEGISLFSTPVTAPEPAVRATMFPRLGSGVGDWQGQTAQCVLTKVVDVDCGEEITEPGRAGELLFAGATLFDGYLGTDNSRLFSDDGYFHTGDLVEICGDPPHYYRIVGRCKDIINRGGMKLSPAEIDILLEGLPNAVEAAVCAYADDELGERVCACVVKEPEEQAPTLQQINDYLSTQGLARFKLPERLEIFDELPRNPLGKVQRFTLQQLVSDRTAEN